ncbi:MAG: NAD(P)-dependent oxidoreductase [Bacteroidota bacterium]
MIAFIGMGHLGSNFVRAMLSIGEQVHVWNRTEEKAKALEAAGAKVFQQVADAVKGASRIHITLSDDAAVDEILELAKSGFTSGVILIDHTTTSPTGTAKRVQLWKERGYDFLHAPVFMGPQNALESTGVMMVSGDQQLIKSVEAALSKMTGKLVNLGEANDKAAIMKLLGNLFMISITGGVMDMLTLGKASGITPTEAASLFDWFNPSNTIPARIKKILIGDFDHPTWELTMARKDARLMMEQAQLGDLPLVVIPGIASEMDKWIEKGNGKKDWSVITKDIIS